MATKFKVWIDNPSGGSNVQTDATYASDSNRTSGFASGDVVSSIKVNSALRSSSLITTALMDVLLPSSNLGLTSTLSDVKTALEGVLATQSDISNLQSQINAITGTDLGSLTTTVNNIVNGNQTVGQANYASSAGSASSATSATNDGSGDNIRNNYAHSMSLSGSTLSLKSGSGSTLSSVTIPSGSGVSGTYGNSTTPVWLNNGTFTKISVGSSGNLYSSDGSNGKWISSSSIRPDRMNNNNWISLGSVSTSSSLSPSTTLQNGALYAFRITVGNNMFGSVAYITNSKKVEIAERAGYYTSIYIERIVRETSGTIKVEVLGSAGSGITTYSIEAMRLT